MDEFRYDRWGQKRGNLRIQSNESFVLNQRVYVGARPDGDGWETIVEEGRWNLTPKTQQPSKTPLNFKLRTKPPRKQTAARAYIKAESRDDKHTYIIDPATEMYFDLGRNEGEIRPHGPAQDFRTTNFAMGAKYAGGTKAIREALKARKEALAPPKPVKLTAEEARRKEIEDLEKQIKQLLGL